jgi:hypothetical protein
MFRLTHLACGLAALALVACSAADRFGDRAVGFNRQAANARNEVLLLNIMRAAFREPLQFSDVASVTGTAQTTGGLAANLPLLGQSDGLGRLYPLNPSFSVQSGPSFAVNILNTKEFYQGLLTPISPRTLDLFQTQSIPPALLFTLFVSEIDLRTADGHIHRFPNRVFDQGEYATFRTLIDALSTAGMRLQQAGPDTFGAPISVKDAASPAAIAGLKAQSLTLAPQTSPTGKVTAYNAEMPSDAEQLCFDQPVQWTAADPATAQALTALSTAHNCDPGQPAAKPATALRGRLQIAASPQTKKTTPGLTLVLRSTESVIYYLGEIAREELLHPYGAAEPAFTPAIDYRYGDNGQIQRSSALFQIAKTPCADTLTTSFHGACYGVTTDPAAADRSTQVLSIVLETLALNTSAKDQPAPSVISILGR